MNTREMLGYCLPTPPEIRRDMCVKFPHSAGYYLPPQYCPSPGPPPATPSITAQLENKELWEKFNSVGTEMILTKNGRRMFPEFSVSLSGLDPHGLYSLCVQAVPEGENRYKWRDGAWSMSGKAEPGPPTRLYLHPESPAPGHRWMERVICFNKIRLTNNTLSQGGQIILQSMHRYFLRLHIIPTSNSGPHPRPVSSVSFPETSFIAVTSYQNPKLSLLKIEENPFAKGIKYFKNQKENYTPRKRFSRPELSGGDTDSECKRIKESSEDLETSHGDSREEKQLSLEERLQVSEESAEQRLGVSEESAEERLGVSEESAEQRLGVSEESAEERLGVSEESTEKRLAVSEESAEQRLGVSEERLGVSEESAERRGVLEESAEEILEVSDVSAEEQEERQPVTKESCGPSNRHFGGSMYLGHGRDLTIHESMEKRKERSQRTDMFVHWGLTTQRPTWVPPSAVSPLPVTAYTPSACLMGHRFSQPAHSGLAPFPPSISNMFHIPTSAPYFVGSWANPPIRLSHSLPGLHPQLLQQMCAPSWYLSPHTTSRGL